METVPKYKNKNYRFDIEYFGIKYKISKSSARRMGKYKAKEVKELSEYVYILIFYTTRKHQTCSIELGHRTLETFAQFALIFIIIANIENNKEMRAKRADNF